MTNTAPTSPIEILVETFVPAGPGMIVCCNHTGAYVKREDYDSLVRQRDEAREASMNAIDYTMDLQRYVEHVCRGNALSPELAAKSPYLASLIAADLAERDALKALCEELVDSLEHMRGCGSCAQDSWNECADGRVANDVLARAKEVLK